MTTIDVFNTPNQNIDIATTPSQEIAVEQDVTINVLPTPDGGSGENGATFTPSVSEDGVISWTNDKGLPNPKPVNIKGDNGKDGKDGKDGTNGKDGVNGKDGYTPQKNVDYFTEADKNEMVQSVINALPKYNGEVVTV